MLICARFSITYTIGRSAAPYLASDGVPSKFVCAAVLQEGGTQHALPADDRTKQNKQFLDALIKNSLITCCFCPYRLNVAAWTRTRRARQRFSDLLSLFW